MGVQGRASGRLVERRQSVRHETLQHPNQVASDGFDISLSSSSLGDEQQTYESDETIGQHQVYVQPQPQPQLQLQHQRPNQNQQQRQHQACQHKHYLASDAEIPSIQSSVSCNGGRLEPRPLTDRIARADISMERADEQPEQVQAKLARQQQHQKHRQLQARIHQQLQRIYGSQLQHHNHHPQQQQQPSDPKILQINRGKQVTQRQADSQDDLSDSHESANMRSFRGSRNNQQSSFERTYDSLSPANLTPSAKRQPQQHYKDSRRAHPISAIPEEDSSEHREPREDLLMFSRRLSDNDDDDDEHDELDDAVNYRPEMLARESQQSKQSELVRKHQLESLHYATVTAAALLNATANAAAAIAATTDQSPWPTNKPPASRVDMNRKEAPTGSRHLQQQPQGKDTRRPLECCRHEHQYRRIHEMSQRKRLQQQQMMMMMKQKQRNVRTDPAAIDGIYQDVMSPVHTNLRGHYYDNHALLNQLQRQQQQQQQQQQQKPLSPYAMQYQQALASRPVPPKPPAREPRMMIMRMNPAVRKEQVRYMQQQAHLPPAPMLRNGLAVIHAGQHSKVVSAKTDLIGRMLINNMLAAQRVAAAESHYNLRVQPPRQAAPTTADPYRMLAPIRDKLYSTANQQQQQQPPTQVLGQPGATANRAPSDSSGHSSTQLVLKRDLAPAGFIERLCRIDLTLFWWSLLVISFLFVGTIVGISRYVH